MGDEDKSFEATPQKLKKAREQGQVIKSQDLNTAIFLVVMFGLLFVMAPIIWNQIASLFIQIFEQIPYAHLENIGETYLLVLVAKTMAVLILPFLIVAVIVSIMTNVLQFGILFTTKSMEPKIDKINPVKGFKNLFQLQKLFELGKNLLKIGVLGIVAFYVFQEFLPKLLVAVGSADNVFVMMQILGALMLKFILMAGGAFFLIGLADYLFQRWKFLKDQKMSFKEVKDEYKQTEGDPMVKQQLRQRRMQLLQRRMLEAVPTADVVTTNPVHIAVALRYNAEESEAPLVVAKGTELFAERIKAIAAQHGVPVVENPPVAQALFRLVDLDHEIPPDLYQAVAEILMFAWQAKSGDNTAGSLPFMASPQPTNPDQPDQPNQ